MQELQSLLRETPFPSILGACSSMLHLLPAGIIILPFRLLAVLHTDLLNRIGSLLISRESETSGKSSYATLKRDKQLFIILTT